MSGGAFSKPLPLSGASPRRQHSAGLLARRYQHIPGLHCKRYIQVAFDFYITAGDIELPRRHIEL